MGKPNYDKEFKLRAVKHALASDLAVSKVAKELGVSDSALGQWIKNYQANGGDAFPGSGKLKPEDQQIKELQKKLKEAETERDILKKAVAFFAKEK